MTEQLSVLEICAGAGGQSLGLEQARFAHVAAVEIEPVFAETLRLNRPAWRVLTADVRELNGKAFKGVDLLAGGVPCPPFSIAGKQLGADDDRDLFPTALRLVAEAQPSAVMLENVRGLSGARFADYRGSILFELHRLGYQAHWQVLNASEYGVPQLRPRLVLVALRQKVARRWQWPAPQEKPLAVGDAIRDLMAARGWPGATRWAAAANFIAPTIVGGSTKHGGPDLGPTRAKREWLRMCVDALGIADEAPGPDVAVDHVPKLTVRMVARLQGFPDSWQFAGRKTAAYRQVGNAFPPPVAAAVGAAIYGALTGEVRQASEMVSRPPELPLVSA